MVKDTENFYGHTLSVAAASPMSFSPGAILGLTYMSAAGAAQFTGAASAQGGRGAELQSKGKHGGNSFRLEPGNCLSIPHVMNAYRKWAANQSTAKKDPFCFVFEELKKAAGTYPPIWRCVGCHPAGDAALALYEQKKDLKAMPRGIVRYGSFHSARALAHCLASSIERRTCVH